MKYGEKLANLRKESGYAQPEVANYLNKFSTKQYTHKMVSHWENGVALPPVEQFLLMCELYNVKDIQSTFRGVDTMYTSLSRLNALGRSRVEEYIAMLSVNPIFSESESVVMEQQSRYLRLFDNSAAAGSGSYLDSDTYVEIEVDNTVPSSADFAIRVSGDSMEPRFINGQIIFIKEQRALEVGEIGIFSINSEAYVKKLGDCELISINPQYEPIKIKEFDSVHVFGKVVG